MRIEGRTGIDEPLPLHDLSQGLRCGLWDIRSGQGKRVSLDPGKDFVQSRPSSANNTRDFCRICGSGVPTVVQDEDSVRIPMGTVDDDPHFRPQEHYYTASKAHGYKITDELPQYERLP